MKIKLSNFYPFVASVGTSIVAGAIFGHTIQVIIFANLALIVLYSLGRMVYMAYKIFQEVSKENAVAPREEPFTLFD